MNKWYPRVPLQQSIPIGPLMLASMLLRDDHTSK
jgi:hypothetical protein